MIKDTNRMVWLDCLRLIAGVSIVGLHASSDISGQPFPDFDVHERVGPVLFRAVVYMARTELFIIISLFLLILSLDKRERSYGETILEQTKRLLIPFAFWVLFFAFFRLIKAHVFGYSDEIWAQIIQPSHWVNYLLLGDVQYHMHFLPTLFALVLLYPLYRIAVNQPILGVIVFLCLFAKREVDLWIWANLQDIDGFAYLVRTVKVITYAGYGFVAASFYGVLKRMPNTEALRTISYTALYLVGLMFLVKLVYSHKVMLSGNWQYNYAPAFWADFLMPVFVFGVFFGGMTVNWPSIISKISKYSFGIYLVHPIFLDLSEIMFWQIGFSPTVFVLMKFGVSVVGASFLVWLISKADLLAWTVGLGSLPRVKTKMKQNLPLEGA